MGLIMPHTPTPVTQHSSSANTTHDWMTPLSASRHGLMESMAMDSMDAIDDIAVDGYAMDDGLMSDLSLPDLDLSEANDNVSVEEPRPMVTPSKSAHAPRTATSTKKTPMTLDRFIPNRAYQSQLFDQENRSDLSDHARLIFQEMLGKTPEEYRKSRVLNFFPPQPPQQSLLSGFAKKPNKKASIQYGRRLDAPGIQNNFYYNLLSLSIKNRIFLPIETGLGNHFQVASTFVDGSALTLFKPVNATPNSTVAYGVDQVISGWSDGYLRVDSLERSSNHLLSKNISASEPDQVSDLNAMVMTGEHQCVVGDAKGKLTYIDFRVPSMITNTMQTHEKIAGLTFNTAHYLAAGTNSNRVNVWDLRAHRETPLLCNPQHKSGVKALSFHPIKKDYLVSGGGMDCGTLYFWNLLTDRITQGPSTNSQICGVHWLPHDPRYFWTLHGYNDASVKLWRMTSHSTSAPCALEASVESPEKSRMVYSTVSSRTNEVLGVTGNEMLCFFKPVGPKDTSINQAQREKFPVLGSFKEFAASIR
jgi:hypothetical protein